MKKIHSHRFTGVFNRSLSLFLSVASVVLATQALVPEIAPFASEGATPELDRGCFDPPACPDRQLCTLGTGRALEPHSHLAAIVCPGGPGRPPASLQLPPTSPPPHLLSHSHSRSLPLSLARLSLSLFHRDLWSN